MSIKLVNIMFVFLIGMNLFFVGLNICRNDVEFKTYFSGSAAVGAVVGMLIFNKKDKKDKKVVICIKCKHLTVDERGNKILCSHPKYIKVEVCPITGVKTYLCDDARIVNRHCNCRLFEPRNQDAK
jgi:hypothetical protein